MKRLLLFVSVFSIVIAAQAQAPVANFTALTPTSGCGFLSVTFSDLSTNNPTSWNWDFGDGTVHSTLKNPIHAYTAAGIYTVKLIATNASGSNTCTKTNFISVHHIPVANFLASPVSGCQPLNVHFTDNTTIGDGPISTWNWNFGDGYSATTANPNHTYINPGNYNIILQVTDAYGCSSSKPINNYIHVYPIPLASFSSANRISCVAPHSVNFSNSSSGTGLTYLWNFGDGATSTATNPSHTYSSGLYTVTLIVTNSNGCKDTLIMPNYVDVNTFTATATMSPTSGCKPLTVAFACPSSGAISYLWDFGDGTTSTSQNPSHTYPNAGNYNITITATNANGCVSTVTYPNSIQVFELPIVSFSANDSNACMLPFTVNFSSIPGMSNYQWNYGDGSSGSGQNPTHTYNAFGNFTVSLQVTNANGCISSISQPAFIQIFPPAVAFTADVLKGCVPLSVNFNSTSGGAGTSYLWNYGDGTSSTGPNPTHIYGDSGVFNVTLTITNSEGCQNTVTYNAYIMAGLKPVTDFYAVDTVICHSAEAEFHDNSSPFVDQWFWLFGDAASSTLENPTHVYQDTGFYSVTLITYHHGCQDTLVKTDYMQVLPPTADFTANPMLLCNYPDTVDFIDQSKGAETWLWTFGDGGTSSLQNPYHVYTNPGAYPVKLVVTNSNGCSDSLTVNPLRVSKVHANFNSNYTEVCMYAPVTFTDLSSSFMPITAEIWQFGDGYTSSGYYPSVSHSYALDGLYSVSLLSTDQWGCTDDTTIASYIKVNRLPSPHFAATSALTGCTPFPVSFQESSTAVAPATLTQWQWTFGDGNVSSSHPLTSNTYYNSGNYNVTLTVTDSKGCDSTLVLVNYILPTMPNPHFITSQGSNTFCYNDVVNFINTSSAANLFVWDFGDGSPTSSLQNPSHQYSVSGTDTFVVTLTAMDANGCDSSYSLSVIISRPIPSLIPSSVSTLCPPFIVNFTDNSSPDVNQWLWNFGDTISGTANTSDISDPQHVYNQPGDYDITLTVTNNLGCQSDTFLIGYIHVGGPTGGYTYTPLTGCSPVDVVFTTDNLNTDSVQMIYGDGGSITDAGSAIYSHTYTIGGDYYPSMVLYNYDDVTGVQTCAIMHTGSDVVHVISGIPDFVSNQSVCPGMPIQFSDNSQSFVNITEYEWDFGDGNTSSSQNPQHSYASPGQYTVSLEITVDNSCDYDSSKTAYITVMSTPEVPFTYYDTTGCGLAQVAFIPNEDSLVFASPTFSWSFGNGGVSSAQYPISEYNMTGLYYVNLMIEYSNGCTSSTEQPVNIEIYPVPIVNCMPVSDPVLASEIIQFANTTNNAGSNITQWSWDFGDGSGSDLFEPAHIYNGEGLYTIMLSASTDHNCIDTGFCTLTVIEQLIVPNVFTPNGDGFNDLLEIIYKGEVSAFELSIFNRWGEVVFESLSIETMWDGTSNGSDAAEGTYFYTLKVTSATEKQYVTNGSTTLIRTH